MKLKIQRESGNVISIIREIDETEAKDRRTWLEGNIATIKRRIRHDMAQLKLLEQELAELQAVLPADEFVEPKEE